MPAVASRRVKGSRCSSLIFVFPTTGSFSARQQKPQVQQGPYPSPLLSGEVRGENQLPQQPQLGRIKQVDLCLEKPSMCSGLE